MKCGANGDTTCTARQGDQCMEHLMTDTPSCPSRVPLTNADRIRAMSDEELAVFLMGLENLENIEYCKNLPECESMLDYDVYIPEEKCLQCFVDWLRRKVKE